MAVSMIPNVTFKLLLHAAFVADEIWGVMLEPARTHCGEQVSRTHQAYQMKYQIYYSTWYDFSVVRTLVFRSSQTRGESARVVPLGQFLCSCIVSIERSVSDPLCLRRDISGYFPSR